MEIRFTTPPPPPPLTDYKVWKLENGCIQVLYYQAWVQYRLLGIPFWGWDNVFLPTEDGTSTIQQCNTDLDAFQKAWPCAEAYFQYLKGKNSSLANG